MSRRSLVLRIVATDSTFERVVVGHTASWVGKCLHCNRKLVVTSSGDTAATVEHIVPRHRDGDDRDTNTALACARCNQTKGRTLDVRRADDPQYVEAIGRLLGATPRPPARAGRRVTGNGQRVARENRTENCRGAS